MNQTQNIPSLFNLPSETLPKISSSSPLSDLEKQLQSESFLVVSDSYGKNTLRFPSMFHVFIYILRSIINFCFLLLMFINTVTPSCRFYIFKFSTATLRKLLLIYCFKEIQSPKFTYACLPITLYTFI